MSQNGIAEQAIKRIIGSMKRVRKAVFPVAGLGTRFLPATKAIPKEMLTIVDRRDAIVQAIRQASAGDVVLIAGKGHEKYQEIAGESLPFDDVAVARDALEARRPRGG